MNTKEKPCRSSFEVRTPDGNYRLAIFHERYVENPKEFLDTLNRHLGTDKPASFRAEIMHETQAREGKSPQLHLIQAKTTVVLMNSDRELLAEAHSYCSINDQFIKKEGTKRALTRLFRDFCLPKQSRKVIWNRVYPKS